MFEESSAGPPRFKHPLSYILQSLTATLDDSCSQDATVYYGYGGDGKMRERDPVDGSYRWFNYAAEWNMIN